VTQISLANFMTFLPAPFVEEGDPDLLLCDRTIRRSQLTPWRYRFGFTNFNAY
jgi:hypothetical protein